ncbi:MAG: hypothetical protein HYS17_08905 [Micavibrio aeruginosavorus]|uniref:Phospholipase n=1 Tax=Micavibrio aeruginosavorus TaxID=349221 RepID=A0A7T5R171_9BACT|nr:MAG: hypothetical protein HYS17_08905 [Micavibrio aeruginosavorus]
MKTSALSLLVGLFIISFSSAYAQEAPPPSPETLPATMENPAPAETEATLQTDGDVKILEPANSQPVGSFTSYYKKKSALIKATDGTNINMTYFWYEPETKPADGQTLPLVLVLHGSQGYAESAYHLIKESVRGPYPAYIMVPALPQGHRWADPGKLKPVHMLPDTITLMKKIMMENPIDPTRVYVMGCGTGGTGAYGAAQLYSDLFAAAVPISTTWNHKETDNMNKVAIAAFHGSEDEFFLPFNSSDTITMVQRHGGTAFFTLFEGMKHDCNSANIYTPTLWQWLFSQKKTAAQPTP